MFHGVAWWGFCSRVVCMMTQNAYSLREEVLNITLENSGTRGFFSRVVCMVAQNAYSLREEVLNITLENSGTRGFFSRVVCMVIPVPYGYCIPVRKNGTHDDETGPGSGRT